MTRDLVLVHGRSQQGLEPGRLKDAWIDAWGWGLSKHGLKVPLDPSRIHFPYYGDTLDALVDGDADVPDVIVRGPAPPAGRQAFVAAVLEEARQARGIGDDAVIAAADAPIVERGPMSWAWVRALAKALDSAVPGNAAGSLLALVTSDVHHYVHNPAVREIIDDGVRQALPPGAEAVVVGHSLGSVVTYNLLRQDGERMGWHVPLHVTVGSPLAIAGIRAALQARAPIAHPACVRAWFNARDPQDLVALHPLAAPRFATDPPVENKEDVSNFTDNRHGIAGYLDDAVVAKRIYDAVTRP